MNNVVTSNISNWRSLIWFATSLLELHRTGVFVMLFDVWYFLHWKAIIITVNMALNSIRRLFLLCEGVNRNVWILLWLRTYPSSVHLFKYHTDSYVWFSKSSKTCKKMTYFSVKKISVFSEHFQSLKMSLFMKNQTSDWRSSLKIRRLIYFFVVQSRAFLRHFLIETKTPILTHIC